MPKSFAFISGGALYVCRDGQPPQLVESRFAREIEARQEIARQRHGWKGESDEAVGGIPGAAIWGKQGLANAAPLHVEWSAVARGPQAGEVTFALQVGDLGGLFESNLGDGSERRLVHRPHFRVAEMERHPRDGTLVYAEVGDNGTIHLALKRMLENNGGRSPRAMPSIRRRHGWMAPTIASSTSRPGWRATGRAASWPWRRSCCTSSMCAMARS